MKRENMDYNSLADQPDSSAYHSKPVENYGLSLLKGMGFDEKKGTRSNLDQKQIEILVLKPRPKGLGLGAQTNEEGSKQKLEMGDRVKIIGGNHEKMSGFILEQIDQKNVHVELHPSKAKVKVDIENLEKITKKQMQQILNKISTHEPKKKKKLKWVVPQIKVKVIDQNSSLYLQKVIITEILNERDFQCRDQNGKAYTNLIQRDLQTIIPKINGIVMIIKGDKKGQRAKILQRKKSKGTVTIQTEEELQIIKVQEDNVTQYVQI